MKLVLRIFLRFLRWLGVTLWFGIWFGALPIFLLTDTIHDPRDVFSGLLGGFGCLMMIVFWVGISIYFAIYDRLPDSFD